MEIRHADKTHVLTPGDGVYFDASTPHGYRCAGKSAAQAIIVTMHQLQSSATGNEPAASGGGDGSQGDCRERSCREDDIDPPSGTASRQGESPGVTTRPVLRDLLLLGLAGRGKTRSRVGPGLLSTVPSGLNW